MHVPTLPWPIPSTEEKGGRLGVGLATPPLKKMLITETMTMRTTQITFYDQRKRPIRDCMKQRSQTHREAAMQKLLFPKTVTSIGTWNVRTLYDTWKSAQVAREMDKYGVQVLGLSEVGWIAFGKVTLASGHELLHSGQPSEDDNHRNGVGIMLTKKANRSLMKWEPIK